MKTDDLYTIILKIYYTLYTIKLKICTQSFYYSSSKFLKFIESKSPLLQQLVSLLKEKWKICPKLTELLSWNGPTFHICCFTLARASTKTFVSRVKKTAKKSSLAKKFVSRVTRQPRYHCTVHHSSSTVQHCGLHIKFTSGDSFCLLSA